jgi:hypothetical protein
MLVNPLVSSRDSPSAIDIQIFITPFDGIQQRSQLTSTNSGAPLSSMCVSILL